MSILRPILASLLFLAPLVAVAGPISEAFSDKVFGVPWGANSEEIKAVLPSATYHETMGMKYLIINDGRPIFGLPRKENNKIGFTLDADGQFSEVSIEFPLISSTDFTERISKLKTLFGPASGPVDVMQGLRYDWPEEDGLKLSVRGQFGVFGLGGGTYVTVKKALAKKPINKADLGL